MNDMTRTGLFLGSAVVLCYMAFGTTPTRQTIAAYSDLGEAFYPEFTDPLEATSIEVIAFDDESGTAAPFKVAFTDGLWSIPSHYNYPADGEERLGKTAAAVIDLKKDIVQSVRVEDHEQLGVIDPLDDTIAIATGRGHRVALRNAGGSVLAEFIVGRPVDGKTDFRYMRLPDKKRTYAVKVAGLDISTRFEDWIERNLLDLNSQDVEHVEILDYTIEERTGQVDMRDQISLAKNGAEWALSDVPEGRELDQNKVRTMMTALADIKITGIRPKPEGMTNDLRLREGLKMDLGTQMSLSSKGFFVSQDGRLLSNEGEVGIGTKDGVRMTLRFGEVVFGEGIEISAGTETSSEEAPNETAAATTGPENRYLFVTASFDDKLLGLRPAEPDATRPAPEEKPSEEPAEAEPAMPDADTANQAMDSPEEPDQVDTDAVAREAWSIYDAAMAEWNNKVANGRDLSEQLNARFAEWYYVISGSDFGKIRLDRDKLLKDPTAKPTAPTPPNIGP
jgi:hypothetical protein